MIDLIDLMNAQYEPHLAKLNNNTMELAFINKELDHDVYTSIKVEQLDMLSKNIQKLHHLLSA